MVVLSLCVGRKTVINVLINEDGVAEEGVVNEGVIIVPLWRVIHQ